MTSLRESVRRLVRGERGAGQPSGYAYRVHWMQAARTWDGQRRRRVRAAVQAVVERPAFVPNEFHRVYRVPELDEAAHAGSSLMALLEVLAALEG